MYEMGVTWRPCCGPGGPIRNQFFLEGAGGYCGALAGGHYGVMEALQQVGGHCGGSRDCGLQ